MLNILSDAVHVTVLTGAGISAESGIPTFRGPDGYWTVGSRHYRPEEMATRAMFMREPAEVWKWYLHRLEVCAAAEPNAGHRALVEMERLLGDRFTLITQNVDGLHLRAGNSPERTLQIHGNIFFMRCWQECAGNIYPLPPQLLPGRQDQDPGGGDRGLPACPACGGRARPHVLWFDESYDEHYFRMNSAMAAAEHTDALIIAGSSGATTLPNLIARTVHANGGAIIEINTHESAFTAKARASVQGGFLNMTCSAGLRVLLAVP
jgi:NAD-dependent deacetylase